MKFRWEKKYLYWGITVFLVIVSSLLFYFSLFYMESLRQFINKTFRILSPLIYGAIIAFLLNTLVAFLENKIVFRILKSKNITITEKKRKITRVFCIFFTIVLFLLGIYALLAMLLPELFSSVMRIVESFPFYVETIEGWIDNLIKDNSELQAITMDVFATAEMRVQEWMDTELVPSINSIIRDFSTGIYGVLTSIANFLIGIVISIYLLYGKENYIARGKQFLYSTFKIETVNNTIRDLQFTNKMFGNYIVGAVVDSAIIGVLCYIGMTIIGLPYPVLISVIVGITNVIPFFGPYLGAVPSAFLILIINPMWCLYFVIFIIVLQQFDGNILKPKIFGDTTGLSSFLVIVSIIIGGGILGIFGMFIGVPVCAVICTILRNRMIARLQKKELPIKLSHYDNMDHLDEETFEPIKEKNIHSKNPRNAFQYKGKNQKAIENSVNNGKVPNKEITNTEDEEGIDN